MVTYGYPTDEDKAKWPEIERLTKIESRKQDLMAQLKAKEEGYVYSLMSGDMFDTNTSWADKKKAEWLLLKQELKGL